MSLQNRSRSKDKRVHTQHHVLSHIVKQWQAIIECQRQERNVYHRIDNFLQSSIPPINASFSPKIKHIASHASGPHTKDKQPNKIKHFARTKKKTLFIEDFDDREIRNSAQSLEMSKNKSTVSQKTSKTISPEKYSTQKPSQNTHSQVNKRHLSLPPQQQGQPIMNNEYIKRILKKFQKQSEPHEEQHCLSIVKSNARPDFRRYDQPQGINYQGKNAIGGKRYLGYFSSKIKSRGHSKFNSSELGYNKTQKRSIQISPWPILQEQS